MVTSSSLRAFIFGIVISSFVLLILPSLTAQDYKNLNSDDIMAALRSIRSPQLSRLTDMGLKSLISRPLSHASQTKPTISSPRPLSTTSAKQAQSSSAFFDAIKARRSYYALNKDAPISDAQIEGIVSDAVLHVPSAFNSQTARLVLLLNKDHDTFWELVKASLKPMISAEQYETTAKKLDGFKAGYGTVLFYEDQPTIHSLEEKFALYKDKFQQWSEHTSAMHQFVLWTALEAEGFGANLQHYNPVVDEKAAEQWGLPKEWNLKAQLVFGGRGAEPGEKQFKAVEERLKVFGKL